MKRKSVFHRLNQNMTPPFLRDNKRFCKFLFALLSSDPKVVELLIDFRTKLPYMSNEDLLRSYEELAKLEPPSSDTACVGSDCMRYILDYADKHPEMQTYFDCACGGGAVTFGLAEIGRQVTGMDFVLCDDLKNSTSATFVEGDICNIPFDDNHFDVVISAHTLEHIIMIQDAIAELRRVAKSKLIIIVPCQRDYKYSLDNHVHFFPYKEAFHRIMQNPEAQCFYLDYDIIYIEDVK